MNYKVIFYFAIISISFAFQIIEISANSRASAENERRRKLNETISTIGAITSSNLHNVHHWNSNSGTRYSPSHGVVPGISRSGPPNENTDSRTVFFPSHSSNEKNISNNRVPNNNGINSGISSSTPFSTDLSFFLATPKNKDKSGEDIEGKILIQDNWNTQPQRGNLCEYCLCSQDFKVIACLHTQNQENQRHTINLKANLIPKVTETLHVIGYDSVHVSPKTFSSIDSSIKAITFENIKNVALEKNSFLFNETANKTMKVVLTFQNCKIPRLTERTLTQNIKKRHGNIYKRENTRYLSIHFIRSKLNQVETNAFSSSRVLVFEITNSQIGQMEPKSIDLDVFELSKFEDNDLPSLPPEAICLHSKATVFVNNIIKSLGNRSLQIETESQVLLEHNTFGVLKAEALMAIQPTKEKYGASIIFTNNLVKNAEPLSLLLNPSFSHQEHALLNNSFQIPCECNLSITFESLMGVSKHEDTTFAITYRSSQCIEKVLGTYSLVENFLKKECQPFPVYIVSAIGVSIILFIVAVTVCVVCSLRIQQMKDEANTLGDCASQSFSTLNKNYNDTLREPLDNGTNYTSTPYAVLPWGYAIPEVRTYQQNHTPEFTEQAESIAATSRGSILSRFESNDKRYMDRSSCPFN